VGLKILQANTMKRVQPKTAKRESKYWDLYSVLQNGVKQATEASDLSELMHVEDEAFYERILLDSMSMSGGGDSDEDGTRSGDDTTNGTGGDGTTDPIDDGTTDPVDDGDTDPVEDETNTTDPDDGTPKSGENSSDVDLDLNISGISEKIYCSNAGEFGEQSGEAVRVEFGYELETTNGGTQVLPTVEEMTTNVMLESFFPEKCSANGVITQAALRSGASTGKIEGVSARPADAVLADVDCMTPPQSGNKCEVYKGGYTIFFSEDSTDAFKNANEKLSLQLISIGKDEIEDSHPEIISMNLVNLDDYNTGNNPREPGALNGSSDSGDDGTNVGIIVGPIIAGVVILALGMYALSRKKKGDSQEESLLEEGNGENFVDE